MISRRMDRTVTIQRKTETQSTSGEPVETWDNLALRRSAYYRPLRGDERFEGVQDVATEQVEFGLRWSADIADLDTRDRIIYPALSTWVPTQEQETGRVFNILAVHEQGRREGLIVTAIRRADVT